MFRPTSLLQAPVVTLLSPSLAASKKAAELLSSVLSKDGAVTTLPDAAPDKLDSTFTSNFPGLSRSWQSVGVACSVSHSVVHFCSLSSGKDSGESNNNTGFALLAITESNESANNEHDTIDSMRQCRELLAEQFQQASSTSRNLKLNLKQLVGRPVTPMDLLQEMDGLPLLDLKNSEDNAQQSTLDLASQQQQPFLKEIVVPFFDYAEYSDGSTVLSRLSQASTLRPVVGVYQWPGSTTTCVRPLPTAAEDKQLPPPSLIFHCDSPSSTNLDPSFQLARIGYSGGMKDGQTMLLHEDLPGLDVRLCPRTAVSSAFSEAQESLLAGSLPELQNNNILLAGGEQAVDDDRIGKGDCWVEVRANLKRPSGFLSRSKKKAAPLKRANIPDIPYE